MVELIEHPNCLEIRPDPGCLADLEDAGDIYEALADHLANGWDLIDPEEIGALTCGTIITRESARNDLGHLVELGRIYWENAYETIAPLDELRAGRSVYWKAVV